MSRHERNAGVENITDVSRCCRLPVPWSWSLTPSTTYYVVSHHVWVTRVLAGLVSGAALARTRSAFAQTFGYTGRIQTQGIRQSHHHLIFCTVSRLYTTLAIVEGIVTAARSRDIDGD